MATNNNAFSGFSGFTGFSEFTHPKTPLFGAILGPKLVAPVGSGGQFQSSKFCDAASQTGYVAERYTTIAPQVFESKAKAVIYLCQWMGETIDKENIGIKFLERYSDSDLREMHAQSPAMYLFAKTMQLLIEESVSSGPELLQRLQQLAKFDSLTYYALCVTQHCDHLLLHTDEFLFAYCKALKCFVSNDGNALAAIEAAKTSAVDAKLVTSLTCKLTGASYGCSFLPTQAVDECVKTAYQRLF